jgi:hypothetical protein
VQVPASHVRAGRVEKAHTGLHGSAAQRTCTEAPGYHHYRWQRGTYRGRSASSGETSCSPYKIKRGFFHGMDSMQAVAMVLRRVECRFPSFLRLSHSFVSERKDSAGNPKSISQPFFGGCGHSFQFFCRATPLPDCIHHEFHEQIALTMHVRTE